MPSITRRRALQGAAALVVGVAGCAGEESASSSSYPPDGSHTVALNPESYSLRNPDPAPTVWAGERPTPTDDAARPNRRDHFFVTTPDEAATVGFADIDGTDGARDFLDATDYDAATVYVEQWTIEECFAPDLCSIQWSADDVETSYARRYRDADVACEADAEDVVVTLIRIPEAFDPGDVNSYGSSYGSGTCERENERIRQRRNRTDDGKGNR